MDVQMLSKVVKASVISSCLQRCVSVESRMSAHRDDRWLHNISSRLCRACRRWARCPHEFLSGLDQDSTFWSQLEQSVSCGISELWRQGVCTRKQVCGAAQGSEEDFFFKFYTPVVFSQVSIICTKFVNFNLPSIGVGIFCQRACAGWKDKKCVGKRRRKKSVSVGLNAKSNIPARLHTSSSDDDRWVLSAPSMQNPIESTVSCCLGSL